MACFRFRASWHSAEMVGIAWLCLLAHGWQALGMAPPNGCAAADWSASCMGSVTCESLAVAELKCDNIAGIPGCADACAEPCCITTTTTTLTSITATSTETATKTGTTTSVTMTFTSTSATESSTVTTSATATYTGSSTMTTVTKTVTTLTPPPTTTLREFPGPFERLAIRVRVTGVQDPTNYIIDSRVSTAYREVIMGITGLPSNLIDLQMVPGDSETVMVTYLLNIPKGEEGFSMTAVEEKVRKETAASFTARLVEKINQYVGPGIYTQEVTLMEVEKDADTAIGVNAAATPVLSAFCVIATAAQSVWPVPRRR